MKPNLTVLTQALRDAVIQKHWDDVKAQDLNSEELSIGYGFEYYLDADGQLKVRPKNPLK